LGGPRYDQENMTYDGDELTYHLPI